MLQTTFADGVLLSLILIPFSMHTLLIVKPEQSLCENVWENQF